MAGPANSIGGYRNKIRTTEHPTLLVEGRTDKRAFEHLKLQGMIDGMKFLSNLRIDTAEYSISSDGAFPSNRQRIEQTCKGLNPNELKAPFVAFADREFDGFTDKLEDSIKAHRVFGSLVYSRGHSIENYLFDCVTMTESFCTLIGVSNMFEIVQEFKAAFRGALNIACAIGLAGRDCGCLAVVRESLQREMIQCLSGTIKLDFARWSAVLVARLGEPKAEAVLESFLSWYERTTSVEQSIVRWMCDGHIGYSVLWFTFLSCVQMYCARESNEIAQAQGCSKDARFNACVRQWAKGLSDAHLEYPREVLDMLAHEK